MSKVTKYALMIAGANLVVIFVLVAATFSTTNLDLALTLMFAVPAVVLGLELIVGIVFALGNSRKDLGGGLLIGVGITLLVGLSVCGIMLNV